MSAIAGGTLLDHALLRRSAELYAAGADRRDKALWGEVLAEDCLIEGPGFSIRGREANLGSIDHLTAMFRATVHRVHNQLATIDGNRASGETYCTADHLQADGTILSWSIRYQDEWRKDDGAWRFTRRQLLVDWEEIRPMSGREPVEELSQ